MPVIQETRDKMFFENANLQHPRRHHEFFLRSRPYRGEPPTVAGLLLYPDTPAKMKTTQREAFCFRPIPQDRGKGQTERGDSSRDREPGRYEQEGDCGHTESTAVKCEQDVAEMQSQYQKDFPPPSSCCRRRTPALPQPDNIGINPAFRIEFSTVQRETYPGWPIVNHRHIGRLRVASSGQPNMTFEG